MTASNYEGVQPADATRQLAEQTIAEWRDKRAARLAAEKVAAGLKKQEMDMKDWLISVFRDQVFEGMLVDGRITGVSEREVHNVDDKAALMDYIIKENALDLLQFRISDPAIFAREQEGVVVPGVVLVTVYDLFDRKS